MTTAEARQTFMKEFEKELYKILGVKPSLTPQTEEEKAEELDDAQKIANDLLKQVSEIAFKAGLSLFFFAGKNSTVHPGRFHCFGGIRVKAEHKDFFPALLRVVEREMSAR